MNKREEFVKTALLSDTIAPFLMQAILLDVEAEGKYEKVSNSVKSKKILFTAIDMINDLYSKIEEVCDGGTDEG